MELDDLLGKGRALSFGTENSASPTLITGFLLYWLLPAHQALAVSRAHELVGFLVERYTDCLLDGMVSSASTSMQSLMSRRRKI